jgi:HlyD family secretion protein
MSQQQGPQQGSQRQLAAANQLLTLPDFSDLNDPTLSEPSKPWWRRRITIIIFAVILLVALLFFVVLPLINRRSSVTYQNQHPRTGDLAITVSATGPLQSAIYNLTFTGIQGSAIIDEINVKVGQKVAKGQVLARLNKTALQDAYDQQVVAVRNAQNSLQSAEASLANAVAVANANTAAAQTNLNNSQNNLDKTQNVSNVSVTVAQNTLNSDQAALLQTQQVANANIASAQTALNNARIALTNAQTQANAQKQQAATQLQIDLQNCESPPAPQPSVTATPAPSCKEAAQNKYDLAVAQANTSVAQAQATVNTSQKSLDQAKATASQSIAAAQAKVKADQEALKQAQAQTSQSTTTAQGTVNSNQQQIKTTQATGNANIAQAQASVVTAQGQLATAQALLNQARHNLDNATLKAPHSGVVTVINGSVGSVPGSTGTSSTTTGTASFIQIVDTDELQIQANVNETDTANLKVGEPAEFTVNSYSNRTFKGTVSAISPNGQTTQNVVTYPVTIDVDKNTLKGAALYPGMTANITITVIQRNGVVLVPVDAVNFARLASGTSTSVNAPQQLVTRQHANAALAQARQMLNARQQANDISADNPIPAFVIVSTGPDQYVAKPIILGLTDGTVYEVLDGLTPADNVIVGTEGNTSTGTPQQGGVQGSR